MAMLLLYLFRASRVSSLAKMEGTPKHMAARERWMTVGPVIYPAHPGVKSFYRRYKIWGFETEPQYYRSHRHPPFSGCHVLRGTLHLCERGYPACPEQMQQQHRHSPARSLFCGDVLCHDEP